MKKHHYTIVEFSEYHLLVRYYAEESCNSAIKDAILKLDQEEHYDTDEELVELALKELHIRGEILPAGVIML